MKKIICFFIIISMLPVINAVTCPSTNQIDTSDIPCEAVTPVINNCTNLTAFVIFLNDTDVNTTFPLTNITDNIFNFSFNFSTEGSYQATLCDNSTATLVVGEFLDFYTRQTYIYIFGIVFGILFLTGGLWLKKEYMIFVGGLLFTVLGVFIMGNGVPEVSSSLLNNGIATTVLGVGIYFMITAYLGGENHGSTN